MCVVQSCPRRAWPQGVKRLCWPPVTAARQSSCRNRSQIPPPAPSAFTRSRRCSSCGGDHLAERHPDPAPENAFALTYVQAMLIQFCFLRAYFWLRCPQASWSNASVINAASWWGWPRPRVAACCSFLPQACSWYPLFLGALFVLACGSRYCRWRPSYVTALGSPATASSRLNLTQAFNSLGTTIGRCWDRCDPRCDSVCRRRIDRRRRARTLSRPGPQRWRCSP